MKHSEINLTVTFLAMVGTTHRYSVRSYSITKISMLISFIEVVFIRLKTLLDCLAPLA